MGLDLSRIQCTIDDARLADAHVQIVGCGGSKGLVEKLARCGVGQFTLIDPDRVTQENICRTDFLPADVGLPKVEVLARSVRAINPAADVQVCFGGVPGRESSPPANRVFSGDLLIAATDLFSAQAWVNWAALTQGIPTLFVGLYRRGLGGEIVFWYPGLPCFRCLMANRYRAQADAQGRGQTLDPSSDGATVFDLSFLDAVAGHIALGLLLRGTDTRFGRLIEVLGDRNFLQMKIDPSYALNGRDVIRQQLGVASGNEAFFSWCTAARRDPDRGQPPCPDCVEAGHQAFRAKPYFSFPSRSLTGTLTNRA